MKRNEHVPVLVQQEVRRKLAEAQQRGMTYAETRAYLGLPPDEDKPKGKDE